MLIRLHGLFLTLLICSAAVADADHQHTFGIVPQQSASKMARLWTPVLQELSRLSGETLHFATAPNIPEFERRLYAGEYDFAYMNPYHYTQFSRTPGYRAFAKQKDKQIRGILVVHKESDIVSLEQLQGKTLAFPSPAAFAASVLPRGYLTRQQISFEPRYVSSHDSVYQVVSKGLFVAGGGIERTLGNTTPELREQLRVLWKSDGYTPHAFAAHPRLEASEWERVKEAMLTISNREEGRQLLSTINFKGITSAQDSDWNDVRELSLVGLTKPSHRN